MADERYISSYSGQKLDEAVEWIIRHKYDYVNGGSLSSFTVETPSMPTYWYATSGTYTCGGTNTFTVQTGYLGIIYYNGTTWSCSQYLIGVVASEFESVKDRLEEIEWIGDVASLGLNNLDSASECGFYRVVKNDIQTQTLKVVGFLFVTEVDSVSDMSNGSYIQQYLFRSELSTAANKRIALTPNVRIRYFNVNDSLNSLCPVGTWSDWEDVLGKSVDLSDLDMANNVKSSGIYNVFFGNSIIGSLRCFYIGYKLQQSLVSNLTSSPSDSSQQFDVSGGFTEWVRYYTGRAWTNWVKRIDVDTALALVGYGEINGTTSTFQQTTLECSIPNYTLMVGGCIKIKMQYASSFPMQNIGHSLSINGETAKPLYYNGALACAQNSWEDGEVLEVFYDGANYQASNAQGGGGRANKISFDPTVKNKYSSTQVQGVIDEITDAVANNASSITTLQSTLQGNIDAITSVYNVTKNHPLQSGYYTLATAIAAIPNATRRVGLIITYQISATEWETKQYVGSSTTGWATVTNWSDFGGGCADFVEVTSAQVAAMEDPS